jgi:hypothetical protein
VEYICGMRSDIIHAPDIPTLTSTSGNTQQALAASAAPLATPRSHFHAVFRS